MPSSGSMTGIQKTICPQVGVLGGIAGRQQRLRERRERGVILGSLILLLFFLSLTPFFDHLVRILADPGRFCKNEGLQTKWFVGDNHTAISKTGNDDQGNHAAGQLAGESGDYLEPQGEKSRAGAGAVAGSGRTKVVQVQVPVRLLNPQHLDGICTGQVGLILESSKFYFFH